VQTDATVDLFSKPAADQPPSLANGTPPRGLTSDGLVRTTGWLQIGDHPVSSAHLAAVVGLLWSAVGAAVLVGRFPVVAGLLVLTAPAVCGLSWRLLTTRVRPASPALNTETKYADDLAPGDLVRLYGSIGPIGQVTEVRVEEDVQVTFHGGSRQSWGSAEVVQLAELLS
jgi:hypothetical protein